MEYYKNFIFNCVYWITSFGIIFVFMDIYNNRISKFLKFIWLQRFLHIIQYMYIYIEI